MVKWYVVSTVSAAEVFVITVIFFSFFFLIIVILNKSISFMIICLCRSYEAPVKISPAWFTSTPKLRQTAYKVKR